MCNSLDDEYIMNIVNEYTTYTEFRTNETSLYNKLIKMGIIHKYTHNLKKNREMNWCVDKIKKEVSKYKYLSDFVDRSQGCYIFIKRNKEYEYLLNDLIYKKNAKWTIDDIWDEVHNHNNFNSLLNNISLSTLKNRNLVKEIRQYYSDMV